MRKIPTLFARDRTTNLVTSEMNPDCTWVAQGFGTATRKFDGTCCMVRNYKLYKRYELKKGKTPPAGFEAAQSADPITGDVPGWVAVGDGNDDKWHREAYENELRFDNVCDGTWELCGPKVQGNPEGFDGHVLVRHGCYLLPDCPRNFEDIKEYLRTANIEGIVWWRDINDPECDKAKVKKRDFGLKR